MTTWTMEVDCPVVARTPTDASCFFGFHDLCPWNPWNAELAVLRVPKGLDRLPDGSDVAEVCVWDPATDSLRPVASTRAWNYQQGARMRWLRDGTLLFNVLEHGEARARIIDEDGTVRNTLPMAVAVLSPDETLAVSPSFGRLARYWRAYGYAGATAPHLDDPCPDDDGLWIMDMRSGERRLFFSIATLASVGVHANAGAQHFVSHPLFNREGTRIAFLHRFFSADGALFTRMFCCRVDGSELKLLASEKVSHFDWIDEDTLIVWSRFAPAGLGRLRAGGHLNLPGVRSLVHLARKAHGGLKAALLSEYYHVIPVDHPEQRRKVAAEVLHEDGHPMMHPSFNLMVSDTYPDAAGLLHLFLYDFDRDAQVSVGHFRHGVTASDTDLKCDLHPRWDRHGERVAVDTCEDGVRRLAIVDVRPALAGLGHVAGAA